MNGQIVKQIDLKITGKVKLMKIFNDNLIFNIEKTVYLFNIREKFTFQQT